MLIREQYPVDTADRTAPLSFPPDRMARRLAGAALVIAILAFAIALGG